MFIGPDQTQRDEQERLKKLQNQKALEKVLVLLLLFCLFGYFLLNVSVFRVFQLFVM